MELIYSPALSAQITPLGMLRETTVIAVNSCLFVTRLSAREDSFVFFVPAKCRGRLVWKGSWAHFPTQRENHLVLIRLACVHFRLFVSPIQEQELEESWLIKQQRNQTIQESVQYATRLRINIFHFYVLSFKWTLCTGTVTQRF